VLLGLGMVLASRATSQLEFQLVYGILIGLSAGSFFAPMISAVAPGSIAIAASRSRWSLRAWASRDDDVAARRVAVVDLRLAYGAAHARDPRVVVLIPATFLVRTAPSVAGGEQAPAQAAGVRRRRE